VRPVRDPGYGWYDPFAGYGPAHCEEPSQAAWAAAGRQLCDHLMGRREVDGVERAVDRPLDVTSPPAAGCRELHERRSRPYFRRLRAITMRWTWLVPS
jgi:hypothetical protein